MKVLFDDQLGWFGIVEQKIMGHAKMLKVIIAIYWGVVWWFRKRSNIDYVIYGWSYWALKGNQILLLSSKKHEILLPNQEFFPLWLSNSLEEKKSWLHNICVIPNGDSISKFSHVAYLKEWPFVMLYFWWISNQQTYGSSFNPLLIIRIYYFIKFDAFMNEINWQIFFVIFTKSKVIKPGHSLKLNACLQQMGFEKLW